MKVVRCWRQWCWCQWSWHQRRWHQCWCQWCWRWWFWPQLGDGESHLFDNFNFLFVAAMGKVCMRSWGTSWLKIWGICQEQREMMFHGSKWFPLSHTAPIHLPHSYMQPCHVVLWKITEQLPPLPWLSSILLPHSHKQNRDLMYIPVPQGHTWTLEAEEGLGAVYKPEKWIDTSGRWFLQETATSRRPMSLVTSDV